MRRYLAAAIPILLMTPVAADAQVGGSYRQSCTDVSQNGSTLTARCKGSSGDYNDTSINVDQCGSNGIVNLYGRLSCGGVRGSSRPSGDNGDGYNQRRPRGDDTYDGARRRRYDGQPRRYDNGDDQPRYRDDPPPRRRYAPPPDDNQYAPPRRRYAPDPNY